MGLFAFGRFTEHEKRGCVGKCISLLRLRCIEWWRAAHEDYAHERGCVSGCASKECLFVNGAVFDCARKECLFGMR